MIKFRAIYEPDGATKDGYLMFYQETGIDTEPFFVYWDVEPIRYSFYMPFIDDDWILMQYTTLNDKKGKDIYDSDIIKMPVFGDNLGEYELFEVRWNGGHWDIHTEYDFQGNPATDHLEEFNMDCEVIGNVYENRYLMPQFHTLGTPSPSPSPSPSPCL
jgi:uncharacterized phage protein (TIGR01671 family)